MNPYWQLNGSRLYQGHVLGVLGALATGSVHCVVTSPPYWGLRDYGLPPIEWPAVRYAPMAGLPEIEIPGCAEGCAHVWGEEQLTTAGRNDNEPRPGKGIGQAANNDYAGKRDVSQGQYCQLCSGWRGCLGLEPTVEMFVGHIVLVARALWRVLREDGTFWLNFGDSYASSGARSNNNGEGKSTMGWPGQRQETLNKAAKMVLPPMKSNLKPKDLIGIPWRVAFALQADGWYLRSDIIWAKGVSFCPTYSGSCMPESVRDRPTKGHEYVFLLSKNKSYFYDGDAVRESIAEINWKKGGYDSSGKGYALNYSAQPKDYLVDEFTGNMKPGAVRSINPAGRNLRTVWTINPGSYAGAHFATFPPALVEPMIKAGTSAKGCCPECGASWERVTEKTPSSWEARKEAGHIGGIGGSIKLQKQNGASYDFDNRAGGFGTPSIATTTGWTPTCTCDAGEPVPCTVLDPFTGSGTTPDVARQLGRNWIAVELSADYCDEHIIPRLTEPLMEWAEQEQAEPVIEQLSF